MKKSSLAWILFLLSFSASAGEIRVSVNGMVCGFCAQGIKKKLSAEAGVEKVDVDLGKHIVRIDTSTDISDEKLNDILKSAGYEVTKIERNGGKPGP